MTDREMLAIATAALEANLETVDGRRYLTAGRHQFRSLWSRDFCYSVRGLLALGHDDVVRDQLALLLAHRRKRDALVPRTLDSTPAKWRVVRQVGARVLPWLRRPLPVGGKLAPEYVSENGTEAVDSNPLVLLAALDCVAATGDEAWWRAHEPALAEVRAHYDRRRAGGLIVQPPFSDWQDSVRRAGCVFLTNLLAWAVERGLARRGAFGVDEASVSDLRAAIVRRFRDPASGLFLSVDGAPQVSLDGNLLAIDLGFVAGDEAAALYAALVRHPLWTGGAGIPGFVTYPDYPRRHVNAGVRWVGLRHYHDRLYWSWLMALSLKTARRMGDAASARAVEAALARVLARDGTVVEVYNADAETTPWSSPWLAAERPFSWGAAFLVDALATDAPRPRSAP